MARPQFSLKTLLWLMVVASLAAFVGHRVQVSRQKELELRRPISHAKWLENRRLLDEMAERAQAAFARSHQPSDGDAVQQGSQK
jgi:hypothetical protein